MVDLLFDNYLMKYLVKEYFFKVGICILVIKDLVSVCCNIERYREKDLLFGG